MTGWPPEHPVVQPSKIGMEDTDLKHGQTCLDALSFLLIRVYALVIGNLEFSRVASIIKKHTVVGLGIFSKWLIRYEQDRLVSIHE